MGDLKGMEPEKILTVRQNKDGSSRGSSFLPRKEKPLWYVWIKGGGGGGEVEWSRVDLAQN